MTTKTHSSSESRSDPPSPGRVKQRAEPDYANEGMLGEVADLLMGNSPPGDTYNESGIGVPLINGPAEYGSRHPKPVKWTSAPSRICKRGDVLICVRGNTTGRVNIADAEYCIGRGIAAIRGKSSVSDTEFLSLVLRWKADRILELATGGGSTFPNITKPQLEELPVPGFSLQEQRAIAAVLRTVQRAKEATEKVIAATRQLKASLMQHLFTYGPLAFDRADKVNLKDTEVGAIPVGWGVVRLGDALARGGGSIQTGPFGSQLHASDYVDDGTPVVMPKDLSSSGALLSGGVARIDQENSARLARHRLEPGDLVVARRGELGRRGLVTEEESGWFCGTGCFRVRPGALFYPPYLSALFETEVVRGRLASDAIGTTMANLNTQILSILPIPVPDASVQREIANWLAAVDSKLTAEERRREALDALFKSLLHHLMTGKVAVGDVAL